MLNIGTAIDINFSFGTNGKSMGLDVPILYRVRVKISSTQAAAWHVGLHHDQYSPKAFKTDTADLPSTGKNQLELGMNSLVLVKCDLV